MTILLSVLVLAVGVGVFAVVLLVLPQTARALDASVARWFWAAPKAKK